MAEEERGLLQEWYGVGTVGEEKLEGWKWRRKIDFTDLRKLLDAPWEGGWCR